MAQRTDYKKITSFSRWFDDAPFGTRYLVGVTTKDKDLAPRWLKLGMRDIDGLLVAGDPNYIVSKASEVQLDDLDEDDNVVNWGIIRKCGFVEFDDEQIWAALLQHQSEFRTLHPITETREQFKERDPIGYDECMAGMERVLYKALGYL